MALSRIDSNPRVGDQAFEAIHSAIMNGNFPSGHRLQIRDLAADLGISVMPVREALKRLEALDLVEKLPYRGAVVKTLKPDELYHIYGVRKLLEVEATRLAVARRSEALADRLEARYLQLVGALEREDVAGYLDLDEEILSEVYEPCGNPVLLDTIRTFWHRCRPFKIAGARREIDQGDREELLRHQRRLIDAVRAGDADTAARITGDSLDSATARINEVLNSVS